jgi:hypothetical protein
MDRRIGTQFSEPTAEQTIGEVLNLVGDMPA